MLAHRRDPNGGHLGNIDALAMSSLALFHGTGITSRMNFPTDSLESAVRRHLEGQVAIPHDLQERLGDLAPLYARMTDPDPDGRPTMKQVADAVCALGPKKAGRVASAGKWVAAAFLAVLMCGLLLASMGGAPQPTPIPPSVPSPPPRPVRGRLEVIDAGKPRLPGELSTVECRISDCELDPPEQRLWIEFKGRIGKTPPRPFSLQKPADFGLAATRAAFEWGLPIEATLGVGSETNPPEPSGCATLQLGFAVPPGLTYPARILAGHSGLTIDPTGLAGGTTGSLPVIGISFVEADAFRRWLNRGGATWSFPEDSLVAALAGSFEPSDVPRSSSDPSGKGRFGTFFAFGGNVLEFAPRDGATVRVRGRGFSGRAIPPAGLPLWDRPFDVSVRFSLTIRD